MKAKCFDCEKKLKIEKDEWRIGLKFRLNPLKIIFVILCMDCYEKEKKLLKEVIIK